MKKRIIIAVLTALVAAALALPKDVVNPIIEKSYCLIKPSECSESEEQ